MTTVTISVKKSRNGTSRDSLVRKAINEIPMGLNQGISVRPVGDLLKIEIKARTKAAAQEAYDIFKARFTYGSGEILDAREVYDVFGKARSINLAGKSLAPVPVTQAV